MERMLDKMAKTLNEYDEASLMNLWNVYAARVMEFEPTKKWEENAIALCLIQAVHWKNQLCNYHLATESSVQDDDEEDVFPSSLPFSAKPQPENVAKTNSATEPKAKAKVLAFPGKFTKPTSK